jgi:hypothetical protein
MFALPAPEDVLELLAEELRATAAELAREAPAQAALVALARQAAVRYLHTHADIAVNSGPVPVPSRRQSNAGGATWAMVPRGQRRRSSGGGGSSAAFAAVRDAYAGAVASSRRVNATPLLISASDEAAELDWLQLAGQSASGAYAGSDTQVSKTRVR